MRSAPSPPRSPAPRHRQLPRAAAHALRTLFAVATLAHPRDARADLVAATFNAPDDIPVVAPSYSASGHTVDINLGFAPAAGTTLTLVQVTGLDFIEGRFDNLAHGPFVDLAFGGSTYRFATDYYGGSGNDFVLRWADSRIFAWGANNQFQLGVSSTLLPRRLSPDLLAPADPFDGKAITAGAAGGDRSVGLCSDGTLVTWGWGLPGIPSAGYNETPRFFTNSGVLAGKFVTDIAVGGFHWLALCSDGTLAAWGSNSGGQIGDGSTVRRLAPVLVDQWHLTPGSRITGIAAGDTHSLALVVLPARVTLRAPDGRELSSGEPSPTVSFTPRFRSARHHP